MSKINIKNFGPINDGLRTAGGWIDIKKVTVFIGNQGSGKSTIAKLISTFVWIEKSLVRGDYKQNWFEQKNRFKNRFLKYHRLENYLSDDTEIAYEGEAYTIRYKEGVLRIAKNSAESYPLPQIMYVPAERNFIAYVKSPKELELPSESLKEFLTEFDKAKNKMKGLRELPINQVNLEYDKLNDTLNLKKEKKENDYTYKVKLTEASSGFQSLVPLYLVSTYLAESVANSTAEQVTMSSAEQERFRQAIEDIWHNTVLTDQQKELAISALANRFNKTAFVNIVEEPEQNLFPTSQWHMLASLLACTAKSNGNKLILTTHSPYIINYLSIAIQANYVEDRITTSTSAENVKKMLLEKLYATIPKEAQVTADDVAVYELDEEDGSIEKLETYEGIPSDNNYLNRILMEGNTIFDTLLEIEQEL